jgi:hypothetical protein
MFAWVAGSSGGFGGVPVGWIEALSHKIFGHIVAGNSMLCDAVLALVSIYDSTCDPSAE